MPFYHCVRLTYLNTKFLVLFIVIVATSMRSRIPARYLSPGITSGHLEGPEPLGAGGAVKLWTVTAEQCFSQVLMSSCGGFNEWSFTDG